MIATTGESIRLYILGLSFNFRKDPGEPHRKISFKKQFKWWPMQVGDEHINLSCGVVVIRGLENILSL